MGVLKFFEGTGDLVCVIATIKTPEGSLQKVVDGTSFTIGRAPDCVLSIPNAGISRLHVIVTIKRGEVYMMDQESSNGTFLNGTKIEPKRLIHVKPADDIKLGLSEVVLQLAALEKHFKTDYIAESLLPQHEKDNLMEIIKASNHKAQEIIASAQAQADHIAQVAGEKARNLENQSLLKHEEIVSGAQVEGQHLISESKRKSAQILLDNENKVKESVQNIYDQAERIRKEAEIYFQNRVQQAEKSGTEIVEHHTKAAMELAEDIKLKAAQKAEADIRHKLASVMKDIEDKSSYLTELTTVCNEYESKRKKEIDQEMALLKEDLQSKHIKQKADFEEQHKRELEKAESSAAKQKEMLESEIQSQRQVLVKVTEELNGTNTKFADVKNKFEDLQGLLKGLQSNEADLIASINDKSEQAKKADGELQSIKSEIDSQQAKFLADKHDIEAQMEEFGVRLQKLKVGFQAESEKLKKDSEHEVAQAQDDFKNLKEKLEHDLKLEKAEIHKKTTDYIESEKVAMDAYKAQMLQEKKELDIAFDITKKEFETRTNDIIALEKQKVEDARQHLITSVNRERQVITDDVTIAIMKIKNNETLTASNISDAVSRVFNSHITAHSVDTTIKTSASNMTQLKVQFMGYGLGIAIAAVFGFKFLIQPQINRHIAGTEEHAQAAIPTERPKYTPEKTMEYKNTYTDSVLYTLKFSEIYLDEQIHNKWFKYIASYMYENWRVDETKTIEALSISKTLVKNLSDTGSNLDAEFYLKGIEKMNELEQSSEKRMIEILGTKVKYEAFRRKEREFFEPYIQNQ